MVPQNCSVSHILQNIFLCVQQEQRHSCRFGTTWGWVNDDRNFIFGWTIPLSLIIALDQRQMVWLLAFCYLVARVLWVVTKALQEAGCVTRLKCSECFLGSCFVVAKELWEVAKAMLAAGCCYKIVRSSEQLLGCCCAVAKVSCLLCGF